MEMVRVRELSQCLLVIVMVALIFVMLTIATTELSRGLANYFAGSLGEVPGIEDVRVVESSGGAFYIYIQVLEGLEGSERIEHAINRARALTPATISFIVVSVSLEGL